MPVAKAQKAKQNPITVAQIPWGLNIQLSKTADFTTSIPTAGRFSFGRSQLPSVGTHLSAC